MLGTVFNIQRFSLFDGPGVRTVVFLKGCPLRCIWCHNPEGLEKFPQIMYNSSKCIGCRDCADVCPTKQHVFIENVHNFNRAGCTNCGRCVSACCTEALSVVGKQMDVETVIAEVMRDSYVYQESDGGMTLSGGEPLYQPDFAIALLKAAKRHRISTCVETCGHVNSSKLYEAAEYTDTFYFDYKATGNSAHKKLCGVPQTIILDNLKKLDELKAIVTLRCPIIPGKNDTPEHILGIAKTAAEFSCIKNIHLEPYHRLGLSKSKKLGTAALYDGEPPKRELLEQWCLQIQTISGKNCTIS